MIRANRICRNENNAQRGNRLARNRQNRVARNANETPAQREARLARRRANRNQPIPQQNPLHLAAVLDDPHFLSEILLQLGHVYLIHGRPCEHPWASNFQGRA